MAITDIVELRFRCTYEGSLFLLACCGDALDLGISPSACTEPFMVSHMHISHLVDHVLSCKHLYDIKIFKILFAYQLFASLNYEAFQSPKA